MKASEIAVGNGDFELPFYSLSPPISEEEEKDWGGGRRLMGGCERSSSG